MHSDTVVDRGEKLSGVIWIECKSRAAEKKDKSEDIENIKIWFWVSFVDFSRVRKRERLFVDKARNIRDSAAWRKTKSSDKHTHNHQQPINHSTNKSRLN